MFTDAMSMLGDPGAVKEAEAMMNDPEFKSEISQYMETLKNNSAFRDAMAEAQRKYQVRLFRGVGGGGGGWRRRAGGGGFRVLDRVQRVP